jgi:hypothetical protein
MEKFDNIERKLLVVTLVSALMMLVLLTSACGKNESNPDRTIVSEDLAIDCSDIENNMVPGLPENLGLALNSPSTVQQGIINYRANAKQAQEQGDTTVYNFYTKNADLMETKLNLFNEKFIVTCK